MRISLLCLLLAGVVAPVCLFAQSPDSLVLHPGDLVDVQVWMKPDMSGEFRVAADGSLADPYYSEVNVAGIPFSLAVERIRAYIGRTEVNPRVWVEPRYRVAVSPAAGTPSVQVVREATTVLEVLAAGGALGREGRLDRVQLHRGGEVVRLDLSQPTSEAGRTMVRSGDLLVVEPRRRSLYQRLLPAVTVISAASSVLSLYFRLR